MRQVILIIMVVLVSGINSFAQIDTSLNYSGTLPAGQYLDSAALARQRSAADSLSMQFIKMPDPSRHNQFIDSALKQYAFNTYLFGRHNVQKGAKPRAFRDQWIIAVIVCLLIYTGILNRLIGKDIYSIVQAFYSKRAFVKVRKEDSLFNSWAFICLFSLFGFTIGLYVFQLIGYFHLTYTISGFELFLSLSLCVVLLFVLKIIILRIVGFIFNIRHMVNEYISILYLTYFNTAFIFLPVVISFSLLSSGFKSFMMYVSLILMILIFIIQYLRGTISMISNFRFPKIYLFIYLCALEVCPVLILIKALDL